MFSATRAARLDEVSARLGAHQLLWFAPRGEDVRPLDDLPQLSAGASLIAEWQGGPDPSICLEALSGRRPDLETYDIDATWNGRYEREFWDAVVTRLTAPSVVLPYRPSDFAAAWTFLRPHARVLGAFAPFRGTLEHKPWVETSLQERGVRTVPWQYLQRGDRGAAVATLRAGPAVLRPERSSGGAGISVVADLEEFDKAWPADGPVYLSIAPVLADAVPLNVAGVVWRDGVSLHPASIQIVGDAAFTTRRFGYCGNDFAAVRRLGRKAVDDLERTALVVGRWLHSLGYLGAFGVDALLHDERIHFTELNPRLQGSSTASAMISRRDELPCVLLEHLAALLHLSAPPSRSLWELASGSLSQVVMHNVTGQRTQAEQPVALAPASLDGRVVSCDLVAPKGTIVEPEAALVRVFVHATVADLSGHVVPEWRDRLLGLRDPPERDT